MHRTVLKEELAKYEAMKPSLFGSAAGKYVLIRHDDVAGVFESFTDAVREGYRRFGNVPFLVKQIAATETPANISSSLLAC